MDRERGQSTSSTAATSSPLPAIKEGRQYEEVLKHSTNKESVWHYYLKEVNGFSAKCKDKKCQAVLKTVGGSTSGLHTHLKSKHDVDLLKKSSKRLDAEHEGTNILFKHNTLAISVFVT
jgi:hypothetical protein